MDCTDRGAVLDIMDLNARSTPLEQCLALTNHPSPHVCHCFLSSALQAKLWTTPTPTPL